MVNENPRELALNIALQRFAEETDRRERADTKPPLLLGFAGPSLVGRQPIPARTAPPGEVGVGRGSITY